MSSASITFDSARAFAHERAARTLAGYLPDGESEYLSEEVLEAEGCWLFFKSEKIRFPEKDGFWPTWAYAVSKSGEVHQVYDFRESATKMREYLAALSLHL